MSELDDVAEWIERAATESCYLAGAAAGGMARTARDGEVLSVCIEGCDDPMLNRVLSLGLSLPAVAEQVEANLAWFAARRTGRFLVHVSPAARPANLASSLERHGLHRRRSWMKFARGRDAVKGATSEFEVRRAGPELGDVFAEIVTEAFHLPNDARPLVRSLAGEPEWSVFVSFAGGVAAGAGALFVRDGAGWLGFGATRPEFRGRGSQAAVMAARLEAALDAGCRTVVTETGEAVPGDPQHSYKNILKAGFRELYLRENFAGDAGLARGAR